ncbi:hypothetical protein CEXT_57241 [Caerostris extrusa]|uniref:Uncharacterized protein n=1 Tax=Caerostris extrusa TaxID=172846 RepID=A0AAV4MD64_CAEEX|nr:hypothetical protein CEXT_57241 [Caerostris extrusa]
MVKYKDPSISGIVGYAIGMVETWRTLRVFKTDAREPVVNQAILLQKHVAGNVKKIHEPKKKGGETEKELTTEIQDLERERGDTPFAFSDREP